MNLPGLITITPDQKDLIDELASMMGASFMEERWTMELLSALGGDEASDRKLAFSRALMREDLMLGSAYECCYALEDRTACAGASLKSDLGEQAWNDIEDEAMRRAVRCLLSPAEAAAIEAQAARMKAISVFDWEEQEAAGKDFIHFLALGVDRTKRGSGAFRRLMDPFFAYADEHGIPCYLETYSDQLESLYSHVGFETIRVLSDPAFAIEERCMVRHPRQLALR